MLQGSSLTSLAYVALTCAAASIGWTSVPAQADNYPSRAIRLIVPSPPGGGTDTQARILAPKLSELLGQTVVIDNRPGASGNIGAQVVSKASPDGYTLLAMISRTVTVPGVLIGNPSLPAKNLKELLAYLKANPGKVAFGSAGIGSLSHLIVELFEQDADVKLLHVPYRGTQPALNDTLSGQVSLDVPDVTIALGQIKAGQLRAFGVTSAQRSVAAPDIPTLAEQGVAGFNAVQWFGLCAPAGTPAAIINKLHDAVVKALNDPDVKTRYAKLAMTPEPSASPAEYAQFVHDEGLRWGKVVKDAHVTPK